MSDTNTGGPAFVQTVGTDELRILWTLINAWRDAPAPALHICGKINSYVLALMQPTPPAQPAPAKIGTIGHIDNGKATLTASILSALQATKPAAQRTWVGLTEQEAAECWSTSTVRTWQAIEAKLKAKNNGGSKPRESP